MARVVLLDWDRSLCLVMTAELGRRGMEPGTANLWKPEEELSKANAESLGRKLREFLKANAIAPAPVIISIGRDRVVLKEIGYPPVASRDEPALVRFQATKDLADAADDVVLDYAPLSEPEAGGERRALAVILRREISNNLQVVCRTAGLKLLALVPRPFGMAGCLEFARGRGGNLPAVEPSGSAAVVLVGQRWAEVNILQGSRLLFSRSLGIGPSLAGEIRRCLAAYVNQPNLDMPRPSPREVYVISNGGETPGLSLRGLHDTLALPVYELDGLTEKERAQIPPQCYSALVAGLGLLEAWSHRQIPVNLSAPKEPVLAVDHGRRKKLVALAGVGVLLLVAWLYGQFVVLAGQQAEIQNTLRDTQDVEDRLRTYAQEQRDLDAMKEWDRGAISWIDEMYDLEARFPRDRDFKITKIHVEPIPPGRNGKEPFTVRLTIQGVVPPLRDYLAHNLINSMRDAHLQPRIKQVKGQSFSFSADVVRQRAADYRTHLALGSAAPAAGTPNNDNSAEKPPARDTESRSGDSNRGRGRRRSP